MDIDELIQKLKESYIPIEMQEKFFSIIPKMNDDEKNELLLLIQESKAIQLQEKINKEKYQKSLAKINAQYKTQINTIQKETMDNAIKEIENAEKDEELNNLEFLENEINNI